MDQYPKVSIYTQVYNTDPAYLKQCIESVLNQTYANFEYILIDNGCTDGSRDILRKYAEKDSRIHLIRFEENGVMRCINAVKTIGDGEYVTFLDSDDWLELNFLDRLVDFAEKNEAAIVCSGSYFYYEDTEEYSVYLPPSPQQKIITCGNYSNDFPLYFKYFTACWGKLIRLSVVRDSKVENLPRFTCNIDAIWSFRVLSKSKCIGIDNSILHYYRKHKKSVSSTYNPTVFQGIVYLHSELFAFLKQINSSSPCNRDFINIYYIVQIMYAFYLVSNSSYSSSEKEYECYRMLRHPVTQQYFQKSKC